MNEGAVRLPARALCTSHQEELGRAGRRAGALRDLPDGCGQPRRSWPAQRQAFVLHQPPAQDGRRPADQWRMDCSSCASHAVRPGARLTSCCCAGCAPAAALAFASWMERDTRSCVLVVPPIKGTVSTISCTAIALTCMHRPRSTVASGCTFWLGTMPNARHSVRSWPSAALLIGLLGRRRLRGQLHPKARDRRARCALGACGPRTAPRGCLAREGKQQLLSGLTARLVGKDQPCQQRRWRRWWT